MKKRTFHLLLLLMLCGVVRAQGTAKYVFYFIGDGMGVNQVNGTEMFRAEREGKIGSVPLGFSLFPVATTATTFSATNSITDSSAGGTALACGVKSYNGAIGMDKDGKRARSVAEQAKLAGKRVGVATSVSVDHATPAAFYAHQNNRSMYYEIATDLPRAGFDFYAGSGFLRPKRAANHRDTVSVFRLFDEAGYTVARGDAEYKQKKAAAKKMILIQPEQMDQASLPYAIDQKGEGLTLETITRNAIDFLMKEKNNGFFLMVEGGKIDWACHNNDLATAFREVEDLDRAVQVAYEFYKKHPKETLIVITADHETGGLGLGRSGYTLNLKALTNQNTSQEALSRALSALRKAKNNRVTWEEVKALLGEKMGFWNQVPLTWSHERRLRDEYEQSFVRNKVVFAESEYAKSEPLAAIARSIMSEVALTGWTTGGHSAGVVPVFAVGAGSNYFTGKMDNIEIPARIAKAARYGK